MTRLAIRGVSSRASTVLLVDHQNRRILLGNDVGGTGHAVDQGHLSEHVALLAGGDRAGVASYYEAAVEDHVGLGTEGALAGQIGAGRHFHILGSMGEMTEHGPTEPGQYRYSLSASIRCF